MTGIAIIFGGCFLIFFAREGDWLPVILFAPVMALVALDAYSKMEIK
jgi:hypothetical protein